MKQLLILLAAFALLACEPNAPTTPQAVDYTAWVNPFIGTDGTGHTFPGPCLPFGMVQPGPDNTDQGWDYTSGYQLQDSTIIGFSQTRASGTGINEFGDVLLFPFVGENASFSARKKEETAEVGYYKVVLNDQTTVELTATERVAFHRYTFSQQEANVLVNLQHGLRFLTDSLVLESDIVVESDQKTISGYVHTKNWVKRKYFFTLVFDQAYQRITELPKKDKENAPKYVMNFALPASKSLQAKISLSTVSVAGAKTNLQAELPHWDFDTIRQQAKATWNQYLGKIDIEAPQKQKEIFYTAMYHLFIHPSNIADTDGRYRGVNDQVAQAPAGTYYSTLSLWDTYRASHPLYTVLVPERVNGFINTLLAHHEAQGFLPIWTAWGQENYCMIGNHAIPVISDAYAKGFRGFDAEKALEAMVKSTSENHFNSDWQLYQQYGYYPFDRLDNEAVSRTLESGFDDYCVAFMAEKMGNKAVADRYYKRAAYYKTLFDQETKLMRGKNTLGQFRTPFDPLTPTSPMNNPGDYTEANAWQYTWASAQHDVAGYMELLGGQEAFTEHLDQFFGIEGTGDNKHLGQEAMIGQYAHGNEPSHHIAYLYAYSLKPEKGRKLISQIYRQFYDNTPQGITGNDDCGQMSAWYIFTTLGFYPVNPANGEFVMGLPQVKKATLHLPNGKEFTISTTTENARQFVLNGQPMTGYILPYEAVMKGGSLEVR